MVTSIFWVKAILFILGGAVIGTLIGIVVSSYLFKENEADENEQI